MSGKERRNRQLQMNAAETRLLARLHPTVGVDLILTNCNAATLRAIVAEVLVIRLI